MGRRIDYYRVIADMKPKDKISFWTDAGNYDLKTAEYMQESGRYVYTAFF
jgi:hypothetical protein